jgi:ABC-type lipopolysaccharide export system ATPase subunit
MNKGIVYKSSITSKKAMSVLENIARAGQKSEDHKSKEKKNKKEVRSLTEKMKLQSTDRIDEALQKSNHNQNP